MTAIGAYYAHQPDLPIHGLGNPELPQVTFADQILRELVKSAPIGGFVPWGEQVSDTTWKEAPREWLYTLWPINDSALKSVEKAAFGHPVPYVGVLFNKPATLNAIERALHGSPYRLEQSLGVYNAATREAVPRVRFLVWARHRDTVPGDGAGGGPKSMDAVAAALNGQLVYVSQGPLSEGLPRPPVSFEEALEAQLGVPVAPKAAPTAPLLAPAVPVVTEQAARNSALLLVGVGLATAVGVGWYLSKRKSKRSSGYTAGAGV